MEGSSQAHEVTPLRAITRTLPIRPRRRTGRRASRIAHDCQAWGNAAVSTGADCQIESRGRPILFVMPDESLHRDCSRLPTDSTLP
jgi:hypothetical protein